MSFKSELDKAISQYDATEKRMTAIQLNPISKEDAKGWSPLNEVQSELMQWGSRIRILENQISEMD